VADEEVDEDVEELRGGDDQHYIMVNLLMNSIYMIGIAFINDWKQ
jgi:hypothetical protein